MIRLGEKPFLSIQGEGNRTGVLTMFIRLFGCNLECSGFGQKCPTNPSSWVLPYQTIDANSIKKVEDLPVFEYGCDSSYSWSSKFKHLALTYSDNKDLFAEVMSLLKEKSWIHPNTKNDIDVCFTGGEPMLQQNKIVEFLEYLVNMGRDYPQTIQIETNGTKPPSDYFEEWFDNNLILHSLNWNISPKLYNVSGEKDAVNVDIIRKLYHVSPQGCLKFVINDNVNAWSELNSYVQELRSHNVWFPIYIMPVGATADQQKDTSSLQKIAERAIAEGYHISGRLQSIFFANKVGT